jgi:hypothetical protein
VRCCRALYKPPLQTVWPQPMGLDAWWRFAQANKVKIGVHISPWCASSHCPTASQGAPSLSTTLSPSKSPQRAPGPLDFTTLPETETARARPQTMHAMLNTGCPPALAVALSLLTTNLSDPIFGDVLGALRTLACASGWLVLPTPRDAFVPYCPLMKAALPPCIVTASSPCWTNLQGVARGTLPRLTLGIHTWLCRGRRRWRYATAVAGAAALPTRMSLVEGRHQHGVPRKHIIRTLRGNRILFNTSSQTPNPCVQEGERTPGWGSSAWTPNPYAAANKISGTGSGWGGAKTVLLEREFVRASNWWASPGPPASGGWDESSWVSPLKSMPTHTPTQSQQSTPTPTFGAPTPASAPTPGGPGYGATMYNAQTPRGYLPTPPPSRCSTAITRASTAAEEIDRERERRCQQSNENHVPETPINSDPVTAPPPPSPPQNHTQRLAHPHPSMLSLKDVTNAHGSEDGMRRWPVYPERHSTTERRPSIGKPQ